MNRNKFMIFTKLNKFKTLIYKNKKEFTIFVNNIRKYVEKNI